MPINGTVFPQSSAFATGEILRMDAAHSLVTQPSAAAEGRRYHNEEYARACGCRILCHVMRVLCQTSL
jgi:hypothetical protein